jgi:3-oxo-5-alpha-steroid 4-dehydrogenase 1
MDEKTIFYTIINSWFILAGAIFVLLLFIRAPYGRYSIKRAGVSLPHGMGWLIMELPAVFVFALMYFLGSHNYSLPSLLFLIMWLSHYLQRTFIYPALQTGLGKRMPIMIVCMGFIFNILNGYINGRYVFHFSGGYDLSWFGGWRFLLGAALFITGYITNRGSDRILRKLRKPGDKEYSIPSGGFYRWVSCPNYLGEILIWSGWAVATWSIAGAAFAVWTFANLAPRAHAHHRWYKEQFAEYPTGRKALIPGLW